MRRFTDIRFQKCLDLEIRVRGHSRSLKMVPFDRLCSFLLLFYSYCAPKGSSSCFWDIRLVSKNTVTLKPGLGSLKVIGTDTYRSAIFVFTFHNNHGPISYRFLDKRRFQWQIAKLAMRMRGTTWPVVRAGCKIITCLQSYFVQLSSATMTIDGRLLSSTDKNSTQVTGSFSC